MLEHACRIPLIQHAMHVGRINANIRVISQNPLEVDYIRDGSWNISENVVAATIVATSAQ
jgi:hypothetical protein